HVPAGFDMGAGDADGTAVLDDRVAGGNCRQRHFVAARYGVADRDGAGIDRQPTTGLQRFERRRHIVVLADDEDGSHWLTPLARKPPSTASTWPVTKVAASDARYT